MVMGPEPVAGDTTTIIAEEPPGTPETRAIEGRSLGRIAWTRLKRDKVAIAGGLVVIILILIAVFAPLIVKLLGHPPNEFHEDLIDPDLQSPKGSFGGISAKFLFGLEPTNGRDLFSRIV